MSLVNFSVRDSLYNSAINICSEDHYQLLFINCAGLLSQLSYKHYVVLERHNRFCNSSTKTSARLCAIRDSSLHSQFIVDFRFSKNFLLIFFLLVIHYLYVYINQYKLIICSHSCSLIL